MIKLPESFKNLLRPISTEFKYNTFQYFESFIKGIILAKNNHVTKFFKISGLKKHFSNFNRFINQYQWNINQIGIYFLSFAINLFQIKEIILALDDTLIPKYGKFIFGRSLHFNHSVKQNSPKFIFGHNWVTIGLLLYTEKFNKWICLTFLSRLFVSQEFILKKELFQTRLQIAVNMIKEIKNKINKKIIIVADAWYAKKGIIKPCLNMGITFISRIRHDAALYYKPLKKKKGRGRRPIYGTRLPTLKKLAKKKKYFKNYHLSLYGEKKVLPVRVIYALWKPAGTMVKILMVDYPKQKETSFFFCTDLNLPVENVLTLVAARWSIEDAFFNLKEHFGLKEWQCRKELAVTRSATLNCLAYSYLLIWSLQKNSKVQLDAFFAYPWYKHKKRISVPDIIYEFKNQCISKTILSALLNHKANYREIKQINRIFRMAA